MTKYILLAAAALFRRLPNFRGKVRTLLALDRILGLENTHLQVTTTLHHPTPYRVRLDLFCAHERMAFFMDRYEPRAVEFLLKLCPDNRPFFDIGANIGLISLPFTALKRDPRQPTPNPAPSRPQTWCIEAVQSNAESLRSNIALNGLEQAIQVVETAVGECEKDVEMQVEKNLKAGTGTGTANIIASDSDFECERIQSHVTTIDRLVTDSQLPDDCGLIKIDTDGYDLFALMGAQGLIQKARPIIYGEFMEYCLHWHGQSIHDVQAFLAPFDYVIFIRSAGWQFTPLQDNSPYIQDAICVPAEQVPALSWCITNEAS